MTKKKRRSAGFSLAEVLIAILIMAMVTTIVAGGIPAAVRAYRNVTNAANAQLLMSTTVNTLRGWLDEADIESTGNGIIKFSTAGVGKCQITTDGSGIYIQEYMDSEMEDNSTYAKRLLVARASGGGELHPIYGSVTYDADTGIISVNGICIVDKGGNTVLGPTTFTTKTIGNH